MEEPPALQPLKKQDMTIEQLKKYNGVDDPHICLAVCGKIYDVTSGGNKFYLPGRSYSGFAGHDATRALGTMCIMAVKDEYDDLAGMEPDDLEGAEEWHQKIAGKYPFVGRLLAPGEEPTNYEIEQSEK